MPAETFQDLVVCGVESKAMVYVGGFFDGSTKVVLVDVMRIVMPMSAVSLTKIAWYTDEGDGRFVFEGVEDTKYSGIGVVSESKWHPAE